MNQPRAEQTFASQNITSELLLDTYAVGTLLEAMDLQVVVELGRTGGLIQGQGATYTVELEIVRTVSGNSETMRIAKLQAVVGGTATTKKLFLLRCPVNSGDTVKIYATSSNASDTAVNGAVWYYDLSGANVLNRIMSGFTTAGTFGYGLRRAVAKITHKGTQNKITGSCVVKAEDNSTTLQNFTITTALGIDTRTPV